MYVYIFIYVCVLFLKNSKWSLPRKKKKQMTLDSILKTQKIWTILFGLHIPKDTYVKAHLDPKRPKLTGHTF